VAVPQLGNRPVPVPPPVAPPTGNPVVEASPLRYPAEPMTGNIDGFRLGALTVSDTVQVTPGYQVALITSAGYEGIATDDEHVDHRFPSTVGLVTVFRRGVLNPEPYTAGEPLTINGRPGRYVQSVRSRDAGTPRPAVIWEYDDDAFAVVTDLGRSRTLTRVEMIDVARQVRSMSSRPVMVGVKLSWIPAGFRLDAAGVADQALSMSLDGQSHLRLIKGEVRYRNLTGPVENPTVAGRPLPVIELNLYPRWWIESEMPNRAPAALCMPSSGSCYRYAPRGGWQAEVRATGGTVPERDLIRMLQGITFADPADPSTWYKATEAVS
jgi:hypothetical protein